MEGSKFVYLDKSAHNRRAISDNDTFRYQQSKTTDPYAVKFIKSHTAGIQISDIDTTVSDDWLLTSTRMDKSLTSHNEINIDTEDKIKNEPARDLLHRNLKRARRLQGDKYIVGMIWGQNLID